jgi:hypothetical protein
MPRFPFVLKESVFDVSIFTGQPESIGEMAVVSWGTINGLMVDAGASTP